MSIANAELSPHYRATLASMEAAIKPLFQVQIATASNRLVKTVRCSNAENYSALLSEHICDQPSSLSAHSPITMQDIVVSSQSSVRTPAVQVHVGTTKHVPLSSAHLTSVATLFDRYSTPQQPATRIQPGARAACTASTTPGPQARGAPHAGCVQAGAEPAAMTAAPAAPSCVDAARAINSASGSAREMLDPDAGELHNTGGKQPGRHVRQIDLEEDLGLDALADVGAARHGEHDVVGVADASVKGPTDDNAVILRAAKRKRTGDEPATEQQPEPTGDTGHSGVVQVDMVQLLQGLHDGLVATEEVECIAQALQRTFTPPCGTSQKPQS
jgi:hypothetical protein